MKFSEELSLWLGEATSHDTAVIFRKELVEVLRDYRTLLTMVLLPVVLYPLMLLIPNLTIHSAAAAARQELATVAVVVPARLFVDELKKSKLNTILIERKDVDRFLKEKKADVIVDAPDDFESLVRDAHASKDGKSASVMLRYDGRSERAAAAASRVEAALTDVRRAILKERLEKLDIVNPWDSVPIAFEYEQFGRRTTGGASELPELASLSQSTLPFMFVFMVIIATLYPAIDLITGERERGTLALLLVAPVSRTSIMIGKLLVVISVAFVSASLGMVSVAATSALGTQFGIKADFLPNLSFSEIAVVLVILFPLIVIVSALSLCLAAATKSFQQSQGYFTPYMLLVLLLVGLGYAPGARLDSPVALLPVTNAAVCLREILEGTYRYGGMAVVFASSAALACYMSHKATHLLDREDLLFGIHTSPERKRSGGNYLAELFFVYSCTFLAMFYFGQLAQLLSNPLIGLLIQQLCIILLPAILVVRAFKLPVKETMSLKKTAWKHYLIAPLLAPFTVFILTCLLKLQQELLPTPEEHTKHMMNIIMPAGQSPLLTVALIALMPAVCEEMYFRGMMQGMLRNYLRPLVLCLSIGIAFGLFHMSVFRIVPTAILGILLGTIVLKTGSIFPAMLLHFSHNASLLYVTAAKLDLFQPIALAAAALSGALTLAYIRHLLSRKGETVEAGGSEAAKVSPSE